MIVRETEDCSGWQALVDNSQHAGPMHLPGWRQVLATAFAVRPCFLEARTTGGELAGILPLYESRSWLRGRELISMDGGALSENSHIAEALYQAAVERMNRAGLDRLRVRGASPFPIDGAPYRIAINSRLDLATGEPAIWQSLSSNLRRKVRKAEKNGFSIEERNVFAADFYPVYARNQRDLGTPTPPRKFFAAMERFLAPQLRFFAVIYTGRLVGGMVAVSHRLGWTSLYVAVDRRLLPLYPTYLLYWQAIRQACAEQQRYFDLGRSRTLSGNHMFKRQWGALDHPVEYRLIERTAKLGSPPAVAETEPHDGLATRIWQKLPLILANRAGPLLRRQIPFG